MSVIKRLGGYEAAMEWDKNRQKGSIVADITSLLIAIEVSVKHQPMRQGDEYFCPKCGCRWGRSESPPKVCAPIKR